MATKMLNRLSGGQTELQLRNFFCRWRDFSEHRGTQCDFLLSVSSRRALRMQRKAFLKWIALIKSERHQAQLQTLSEIVTDTTFKQRVFLALKQAVQQSKNEMSERKFQAWKNWCESSRKEKFFGKKEALVANIEGVRAERLLKACFDAIRFHNTNTKFEQTRAVLEAKIPEREELEYRRECITKQAATKTKYHALRQCYLRHCDVKYRALKLWRENVAHYKHTMERVKLRLINEHKRRLNYAFMRMKEGADKTVHMEMMVMTEDIMNENQNLSNELSKKKEVREKQVVRSGRMQISKLERVRNLFNRKSMRAYYERWVAGALYRQALDQAMVKLNKTEKKHRTRVNFAKFRAQAKAARRGEHIQARCDWLDLTRKGNSLRDCMATWKENVRKIKLGKKFLLRAIHGMERNDCGMAFKKWKNIHSTGIQMEFISEQENMQATIQDQELQIDRKKREIESCQSGKVAIVAKSKNLSKKVMANYMTRMTQMQLGRGFYTWLENTRDKNMKKRTLKKTLIYWSKKQLMSAFRTWAQNHYKSIQEGLDAQIKDKAQ